MNELALFAIGSERQRWLGARGAALSANIANADTPGYKARDIAPFQGSFTSPRVGLEVTHPAHLVSTDEKSLQFEFSPRASDSTKHSGNTVELETELTVLGEVRSHHALVTGIISSFNRMLLASTKG